MTYKFPLQRLLELREQREQAMALELTRARDAADEERRVRDDLATARDSAHERVASISSENPTVGHLVSLTFALSQLGERVNAAQERTEAAEATVDEKRDLLTSAAQDRQILDRLRARRHEEFRTEAMLKERLTMDAIALSRHGRTDSDVNGNSPTEEQA
jgi:flagellar FliJ protein